MDDLDSMFDRIDAAIDAGEGDEALRLARRAAKQFPDEPDAHWILGDTLTDAGEVSAAREAYAAAARLAPDSPEILASLAWSQFALTEFEAARETAERANVLHEDPAALSLLGRLAERDGSMQDADRYAQQAHALDPEMFPLPIRVSEEELRQNVAAALDRLPEEFRVALDGEVAVLVDPVPGLEILRSEDPPWDPELLGIYVGVPLPERQDSMTGTKLPDVVHLFHHNLEHAAASRDELLEQIAVTVYHEIGHYLGYDDDELDERGFA